MTKVDVLFVGYVGERVAGTVSLIRDDDAVIVVDPGMVPARSAILESLADLGVTPAEVTDVFVWLASDRSADITGQRFRAKEFERAAAYQS